MSVDRAGDIETISPRRRFLLLGGAWALAFLVLLPFGPGAIALLPFYPAGLFFVLGIQSIDESAVMTLGWTMYLVISIALLTIERRRPYLVLLGVLCVLLALNSAGCFLMLRDLSRI